MGLFDKKFCDVCGEKIGLLGNRKLEDGNLCKDCAKKLSPFFSERKHSTVEEIKAQLAYREENKRLVQFFSPTKDYGFGYTKVYVDINQGKFIVTSDSSWHNSNPDIIDFSQVTTVNTNIEEHRSEIYYKDNEGNDKSYNPPRYEYEYEFEVEIIVDSPWFSEIRLELSSSSRRPESRYSPQYNELEMMMNDLVSVLTGRQASAAYSQPVSNAGYQQGGFGQGAAVAGYQQNGFGQTAAAAGWFCQNCGTKNSGNFCQGCGAQKPMAQNQRMVRCDKCGWTLQPGENPPRFCPQCGDPIDFRDMQ